MIPTTHRFVGRSLRKGVSSSALKKLVELKFGVWRKKNNA